MATRTKFHAEKIYVPKEVQESLSLEEGDEIEFTILEEHEARISVRKADADQELLETLERPRKLGVKGKLTRKEIYAAD